MRQSNIPTGEAKLHPGGRCDANDPDGRMDCVPAGFSGAWWGPWWLSGNKDLDLSLNAQIMRSWMICLYKWLWLGSIDAEQYFASTTGDPRVIMIVKSTEYTE